MCYISKEELAELSKKPVDPEDWEKWVQYVKELIKKQEQMRTRKKEEAQEP